MHKPANYVGGFLAVSAMIGFLIVFWSLGSGPGIPDGNKELFNMALMALCNFVSGAFGYYLGSSLGSSRKNELIASPPSASPDISSEKGSVRSIALLLFMALLAGSLLAGCATTSGKAEPVQITAGKTLLAVRQTIINTREAFAVPCQQGIVDRSTCNQVQEIYLSSMPVYDTAVEAAILAINTGSDAATTDYAKQKQQLDKLAGSITALAIQYAIGVPNAAR